MADRLTLDDQLCYALYAASNALTRSYRPLLDEIGLTYPQYLVLLALWQDGPMTVGALATRLSQPQNAVGQIVIRLSQKAIVRRTRAVDRRQRQVTLTDAGRALEAHAAAVQGKIACDTGLCSDDLARLRDEIKALTARVEARRDAAPAEP